MSKLKLVGAYQKDGKGWTALEFNLPEGMKFSRDTQAKLTALNVTWFESKDGKQATYMCKDTLPFDVVPTKSRKEMVEEVLKDATAEYRAGVAPKGKTPANTAGKSSQPDVVVINGVTYHR
jgi:hypothetical protein